MELYRRLGDRLGLGYALAALGSMLVLSGRIEQSAAALAEALTLLEQAGAEKPLANCFEYLGYLKMMTADPTSARNNYQKALLHYRAAGADRDALTMLGHLADLTWQLGDLDAALADLREAISLLRKSPTTMTRGMLGNFLSNLAGILTERGELDEALAAAREGLSQLKGGSWVWINMDHLALRAGLVGKVVSAARLAGFADAAYAAREMVRQPNEARAHDRLHALLRNTLAADEVERLLSEGAKLTEDEACQLALAE